MRRSSSDIKTAYSGNLSSFIDREVYVKGGFEAAHLAAFMGLLPKDRGRVALAIGANVGTHSLANARRFIHVHAFEPNPAVWPQFERNIALNHPGNVTLHKIGLGDRDVETPFFSIDKPNYGLGTCSTVEQHDKKVRHRFGATCRQLPVALRNQTDRCDQDRRARF
jgi:FkbM family methyltransferase